MPLYNETQPNQNYMGVFYAQEIGNCVHRTFLLFLPGYWPYEYSVRQWSGRLGFNPMSSHTKDLKMVLDAALLNTQHYKVRIKGKVEQSRE